MGHQKFQITVTLTSGKVIKGVREFTGTKVDPREFYSYQAKKYYKDKLKSVTVQLIFDATIFQSDPSREKDPNKPSLGERG